ncbi:unnamed protein product [Mytilus coruscus]|uniref:B box-type domain-containing protein n=1 Tax=Mytilus coruscus TaxID=42192 RepID=A0A6J8E214_MYTCO|nr:unnamed protein product [Mytilus coruscus]
MLKRCNSQVAITCQICKESRNVKWRCMDCDLKTICERCKENHSNDPSISEHTIVNFTDIPVTPVSKDGMEQRLEAEIRINQCTRHNKKTYNFFCRTCNFLPINITINLKGDLLFISDYCLKSVTKNAQGQSEILDIFDFYPLIPKCVHYDKERDITLVGLTEDDSNFQLTKRSVRKVVAVNQRTPYKEFQYAEENKRLFTLPVRIISIKDGGICVIDRVSQTTGKVLSLNWEGNLMWIYKDPSLCSHPFYPTDMTITNTKIIIVVDSRNRAFHILNTMGTLILHQPSIDLGIERPFCLDTDKSGFVWVGCLHGTTSRENGAKMYKLKIKGLSVFSLIILITYICIIQKKVQNQMCDLVQFLTADSKK